MDEILLKLTSLSNYCLMSFQKVQNLTRQNQDNESPLSLRCLVWFSPSQT